MRPLRVRDAGAARPRRQRGAARRLCAAAALAFSWWLCAAPAESGPPSGAEAQDALAGDGVAGARPFPAFAGGFSRVEPGDPGAGGSWLKIPGLARSRFAQEIREISDRYGVSTALVESVIRVESAFNPLAVSPKGARGLMQLMPETAQALGVRNSFDPRQNIDGGVRHLRRLLERYPGDLALVLAAYNAGEGAVDNHGGVPPYTETQQYIRRVLRSPDLAAAGADAQALRPPALAPVTAPPPPPPTPEPPPPPAAPPRRITLRPASAEPALPLLDEARRASRPGASGNATGAMKARQDGLAHSALGNEPAAQALARMKQKSQLAPAASSPPSTSSP